MDTDQEQLAAIDVLFGPFPEDYARVLDHRFPGTFNFDDGSVAVRYPTGSEFVSNSDHAEACCRLELLRPISVSLLFVLSGTSLHVAGYCTRRRPVRLDPEAHTPQPCTTPSAG